MTDARKRIAHATFSPKHLKELHPAFEVARSLSLTMPEPMDIIVHRYEPANESLCLATISLPIEIKDLQDKKEVVGGHRYRLWHLRKNKRTELFESLLEELHAAWGQGARVICVNELGFPSFPRRLPRPLPLGVKYATERSELKKAVSRVQKFVEKNNCYVLAGSFHSFSSWCNTALLFFPKAWSTEKKNRVTSPVMFDKLTTGSRVHEVVRTPCPPQLRNVVTQFGTLTPLICSDVLSPNVFFSMVQHIHHQGRTMAPPQFVLNPSMEFVKPYWMIGAAERMAMAGGIMTVFVNRRNLGAVAPVFPQAFAFGGVGGKSHGQRLTDSTRIFQIDLEALRNWSDAQRMSVPAGLKYAWGIKEPVAWVPGGVI